VSVPTTIAGRAVVATHAISGGDINDAYRVELEGGDRAFVKTRAGAAPGEYATEAAGLRWLGDGGARVPEVLEAADGFLALEWLERERADEEELGRRLAQMHLAGAGGPGAAPAGDSGPLRIGPLTFERGEGEDWPTYYGETLLLPLAEKAGLRAPVERVRGRLAEMLGKEDGPSRLHGDLWSGNVFGPYLIDPAAYGGDREVDLAMLHLFGWAGGSSSRTMSAYDEIAPRRDGHEERQALYQLFPLLVHAVLFGGSYVASAERTARRYA
jgi:fructosamine-3-kinase